MHMFGKSLGLNMYVMRHESCMWAWDIVCSQVVGGVDREGFIRVVWARSRESRCVRVGWRGTHGKGEALVC